MQFCYSVPIFCYSNSETSSFVIALFFYAMQFGIIYFPPKCKYFNLCRESKMADEQEMIRRLLCNSSNSVSSIINKLTSETLTFDRIDSLHYRVDWLYRTTVRYLDTRIIDARIVRCLREAGDFLYGSRSGQKWTPYSTSCQAQQICTGFLSKNLRKSCSSRRVIAE